MRKASKTAKVITPKHDEVYEIEVYAYRDARWPDEYYEVVSESSAFSVGLGNVDQYIEVFTKIKKQLEKAGK